MLSVQELPLLLFKLGFTQYAPVVKVRQFPRFIGPCAESRLPSVEQDRASAELRRGSQARMDSPSANCTDAKDHPSHPNVREGEVEAARNTSGHGRRTTPVSPAELD
jgi:hypothetical protein